jgi:hypothetical protein
MQYALAVAYVSVQGMSRFRECSGRHVDSTRSLQRPTRMVALAMQLIPASTIHTSPSRPSASPPTTTLPPPRQIPQSPACEPLSTLLLTTLRSHATRLRHLELANVLLTEHRGNTVGVLVQQGHGPGRALLRCLQALQVLEVLQLRNMRLPLDQVGHWWMGWWSRGQAGTVFVCSEAGGELGDAEALWGLSTLNCPQSEVACLLAKSQVICVSCSCGARSTCEQQFSRHDCCMLAWSVCNSVS